MNVGKAVYEILTTNTQLTALVGTRVYPEMAPEEAQKPYLVYSILSIDPTDTKQASSTVDVSQLETYAVSEDYTKVMDVSEAARAALDRNSGTFSNIAIQSVQYQSSDTEYNPAQRVYIAQQLYSVRQLRTGQATSATLVTPETILLTDGAGNEGFVNTIEVDPLALSISGAVGTLDYSYIGIPAQLLTHTIGADYLKAGALEIDLNNVTASNPTLLPFTDEVQQIGTAINENASTGYFIISDAGTYQVSVGVGFYSTGNGVAPHYYVRTFNATEGQVNYVPEATAYINGTHGMTHDSARTEIFIELLANTRLYIYAYDESTTNASLTILNGRLTVRRIH